MTSNVKSTSVGAFCLAVLAFTGLTARADPIATPGDYSLTIYDPNGGIVYQVEQNENTINPNTIYDFYPENSITIGNTSYLLWNIAIFGSGELEFPNALPTALYVNNPITGPWQAIFGLAYDSPTTWNGNTINYYLGFAATPPGQTTPEAPDGAGTYDQAAYNTFYNATQYLATDLQELGYTAYFYDPGPTTATPEPTTLTLLGTGAALLGLAGVRRRRQLRANVT